MTAIRNLALALVATLGLTATASAQVSYYAGVVKNNTDIKVTYQYKHNNGAWVTVSLSPGQKHVYSFRNPAGNQTVHLRFDRRLGDGKLTYTTTTLAMHGTTNPNDGWLQIFNRVNDRYDLHLHARTCDWQPRHTEAGSVAHASGLLYSR